MARSGYRTACINQISQFSRRDGREVFTCLGEYYGCLRLMNEIAQQETFLGPGTWLISWMGRDGIPQDCGTIQGMAVSEQLGSIQNIGVVPEHRGLGLGRALIVKSLGGFQLARLKRVALEVTANNVAAVELYRSLGFRIVRTMYRMSRWKNQCSEQPDKPFAKTTSLCSPDGVRSLLSASPHIPSGRR